MTICTSCGSIYHVDDMDLHVCDPDNIPQKGEEIRFDGTKIRI